MVFWKKKQAQATSGDSSASTAASQDSELNPTGVEADQVATARAPIEPASGGWLASLKSALKKTNDLLHTDIRDLWKAEGRLVDEDFLQDFFTILVKCDMGQKTASRIRDRIATEFRGRKVEMKEILDQARQEVRSAMQDRSTKINLADSGPTIILVVGVNGVGKTTSIAKLANRFAQQGKKVILGAGDTFRAAAVEQLRIWSQRIGCEIVSGEANSDPGSVAFKAIQKAREENFDICIIDTAGRLQTQSNLMQQLDKIRRLAAKQIADAPHEVLLVLDATAGQNAISQARGFSEAAGCTGIVLAKLDGTAKGGVIVPILLEFGLPVKLVGLGEKLSDLVEFDPDKFTEALFDFGDA